MKLLTKPVYIFLLALIFIFGGYKLVNFFIYQSRDSLFMYAPQIKKVKLYFVNQAGKLQVEKREIQGGVSVLEDVRICVDELAVGPKEKGLYRGFPAGASLNGVYIDDNRCIYLDFGKSIKEKQEGGTTRELQMIYSLVNTILDNFGQVTSVRILVEGQEIKTIGGHIDVNQPLRSRKLE